jgi:hypothetical protein
MACAPLPEPPPAPRLAAPNHFELEGWGLRPRSTSAVAPVLGLPILAVPLALTM